MLSFDTILEKARQRNREAFMRLYDLCSNAVFNASYRIVLNAQDAEEIAQDAILKVFSNIGGFKGTQRDFVALVKTIAINKSIDVFRKRRKEPFFEDLEGAATEVDENDSDLDDFPIERIKDALNGLSEGYRLTISLHLLDDMGFAEIAQLMGVKESTVRSQYVRGLQRLKFRVKSEE